MVEKLKIVVSKRKTLFVKKERLFEKDPENINPLIESKKPHHPKTNHEATSKKGIKCRK
jgi:hypothetical protein